jgi:hypothetical protein
MWGKKSQQCRGECMVYAPTKPHSGKRENEPKQDINNVLAPETE